MFSNKTKTISNNTTDYDADAQAEHEKQEIAALSAKAKNEARVTASVGQNVVLGCAVDFKDGIEKPFVVNWLKHPTKLPIYIWYAGYPPHVAVGYEKRVSRIGQASLNITQVRQTDNGLYECLIHYLDRWPEKEKANGSWIYLDVQGLYCLAS